MADTNMGDTYRCIFCGADNEFTEIELYEDESDGKQVLKEKFCKYCGEIIIKTCPVCTTSIIMDSIIKKRIPFKVDFNGFNEPIPSPLDTLIPEIKKVTLSIIEDLSQITSELFRKSQAEYLEKLPKAVEDLQNIIRLLKEFKQHTVDQNKMNSIGPIINDLQKDIEKAIGKVNGITKSITPEMGIVDKGMDKKLRKGDIPLIKWKFLFDKFLLDIGELRDAEIKAEIDSYQPGMERVKSYLLYDPENYNIICPKCNTMIYCIEGKDFIFGVSGKHYEKAHNLTNLVENTIHTSGLSTPTQVSPTQSPADSSAAPSATQSQPAAAAPVKKNPDLFKFKVLLNTTKTDGTQHQLHANLNLILKSNDQEVIGRDSMRHLLWEEDVADDILMNAENDILQMISRSQFRLFIVKGQLMVQGQEFNEMRIGTYINSIDNDIRKTAPRGTRIATGNKIIVPTTLEQDNPNRISMELIN